MIYILMFIIGACVGSFLTLVSIRRNKNEVFIIGRSHCDHCNKTLKVVDNIPIISYFLLRGKSSCCNKKIDPLYPIFEVISGIGFVLGYLKFGFNFNLFIFLIIFSFCFLIAITDLKYMDIYDIDTITLTILLINFRVTNNNFTFDAIKSMCFLAIIFYAIYKITGVMGSGDALLSIPLGIVSSGIIDALYNFTYTFLIGAVVAIVLILFKIKDRKDYIPFGPFIVITIVGVLLCKL